MKHVTINVSEPVYKEFKAYARKQDKTTSGLIREAMEMYLRERVQQGESLKNISPLSLGKTRKTLNRGDDLLGEMTHAAGR